MKAADPDVAGLGMALIEDFQSYREYILDLNGEMVELTAGFFKRIIQKPMNDIQHGINRFRNGRFETTIDLHRKDEWNLIETALNTMAEDLSACCTALQKSQGFVSNIITSIPSSLVGVDADLTITQWNTTVEQRTGITATRAYGQHITDLLPNTDIPSYRSVSPPRRRSSGIGTTSTNLSGGQRFPEDNNFSPQTQP